MSQILRWMPNVNLFQQKRMIHLTAIFYAEPLKKKKVIDPLTTKKQFERKVRRYEREIKRLEAIPPKLKPILELQLPPHVVKELDQRKRKNDPEDNCHKLMNYYYKIWSIYKHMEAKEEIKCIKAVVHEQEKALNVLKRDYPELYEKAVQIDEQLIPYKVENVKKNTPPNESYKCPDGIQTDITKEWRM